MGTGTCYVPVRPIATVLFPLQYQLTKLYITERVMVLGLPARKMGPAPICLKISARLALRETYRMLPLFTHLFSHWSILLKKLLDHFPHNFTGYLCGKRNYGQASIIGSTVIHEVNSPGEHCIDVTRNTFEHGTRARIFKLLRSPRIDSKELIPSGCVAWRASTTTLFLLGS